MIEKGRKIKLILKNNMIVEGFVELFNNEKVILNSLDGVSVFIVQKPEENILVIKLEVNNFSNKNNKFVDVEKKHDEIEEKFNEMLKNSNPYNVDHVKKLAELKKELNKQEKEIISSRLKNHYINQSHGDTKYGYPGIFTRKGSK